MPGGRPTAFAYWTVTISGGLSHTLLLAVSFVTPICRALQPHTSKPVWFGLFPGRSPLLGDWSLFLWVLRCFSSPGSRPSAYVFSSGHAWVACVGFPIRTPPDRSLYTAPRGFSQCPASFFGVWRQGIHRKPFVASFRDAESSTLFRFSRLLRMFLMRGYAAFAYPAHAFRALVCCVCIPFYVWAYYSIHHPWRTVGMAPSLAPRPYAFAFFSFSCFLHCSVVNVRSYQLHP